MADDFVQQMEEIADNFVAIDRVVCVGVNNVISTPSPTWWPICTSRYQFAKHTNHQMERVRQQDQHT